MIVLTKSRIFNFRIENSTIEKIRQCAVATSSELKRDVSMSEIIRAVIEEHLSNNGVFNVHLKENSDD